MELFRKLRMLVKFLFYFWTKKGSNVVWPFLTVFYFPDHSHNLISVSKISRNGAQLNFGQSLSNFSKENQLFHSKSTLVFTFRKKRHLFFVLFPARTKRRSYVIIALVTTISKMWSFWLIMFREWAWKTALLISVDAVKFWTLKISKSRHQPVTRKLEKRNSLKLDLVFRHFGTDANYFAWWQSVRYFFRG